MAGKPKKTTTGGSKRRREEPELEESQGVISELLDSLAERFQTFGRALACLVVVALGVAWIVGLGPLENRVAAVQSDPISASFTWPVAPGGNETWAPRAVRDDMQQLICATVSMDPFDAESLERAYTLLAATGWFEQLNGVRRAPGGRIVVDGVWRTPAAVVRQGAKEYLVGTDTAVMRLPGGAAPASLFRIMDPLADVPRDLKTGDVLYGRLWPYDDVDHAIALLERIAPVEEADAIVAVDLSDYPDEGRLSLVTDSGCRLVWGAPIDEPNPGEVTVEAKLAHLRAILDPGRRLDRGQRRIEVFTEHVFIDRTPGGGAGE